MDLSEFSQKFGVQSAPTYQFRGEPFNLRFDRYENGNWQINLLLPNADDKLDKNIANELTVAIKSKIADDFIALDTSKQEYIKFLLKNNIIVKHPFFAEKETRFGQTMSTVNETYQFTPDFVSYVQQKINYNMSSRHDVEVKFTLDRRVNGFTRLIFDRDVQLKENPDLGKNNSETHRGNNESDDKIGTKEEQVTAANILENLTYLLDGEELPVELNVKKYAVTGNWYIDLRDDNNMMLCVVTDHGPKLSSKYQMYVNLVKNNSTGRQISIECLKQTQLFEKIDQFENKAKLNTVGLIALQTKK